MCDIRETERSWYCLGETLTVQKAQFCCHEGKEQRSHVLWLSKWLLQFRLIVTGAGDIHECAYVQYIEAQALVSGVNTELWCVFVP